MTQNVSYHITYVEIFTMDRKLNILSQVSQIFHESSFICSVVMCGLSLQLSEYGTYDFANNASKVSITCLPPCLPPCHPPLPFSSSRSSSFSASFSTATVAVKCMNFKFSLFLHTHTHMHTHTHTMLTCIHTCTHVHVHSCTHVHLHSCTHAPCTHGTMHTLTHAHVHIGDDGESWYPPKLL